MEQLGSPLIEYIKFEVRLPLILNWQRCLSVGEAKYCAFLHDDDLWRPSYLNHVMHVFSSTDAEAVLTKNEHISADGIPNGIVSPWLFEELDIRNDIVSRLVVLTSCLGHMSALVFKRGTGSFRVGSYVAGDQLFVDQYVHRNALVLNPSCDVLIRDHVAALSSNARKGRWSIELIDRIKENLIIVARIFSIEEKDAARYSYKKGKAAYFQLMVACYGNSYPPFFDKFRARLTKSRLWASAPGDFTQSGWIMHIIPPVFKSMFCRYVYHRIQSRDLL